MTESGFAVARLDDVDRRRGWTPIRAHFGIRAFGVNAWTADEAGGRLIAAHNELPTGHEELYLVVRGHAVFDLGGAEVDGPEGTLVFVRDPALVRSAIARVPGTTVLTIGAQPGNAFEISGWEAWRDAQPFFEAGDYGGAAEILRSAHELHPDDPALLYNLACCESLGGRHEQAVAHLLRSAELNPRFAELARDDADFDAIRADPEFLAVAGQTDAGRAQS